MRGGGIPRIILVMLPDGSVTRADNFTTIRKINCANLEDWKKLSKIVGESKISKIQREGGE